jgi:tetratricopeptide (TPR) repeat protein
MIARNAALLGLFIALAGGRYRHAEAHDGPAEVVAALTAEIERFGPTAERFYRRGTEYRALGDLAAAEADLRRALARRREFPTLEALVRVLLSRGATKEAVDLTEAELKSQAGRPSPGTALFALAGEVRIARHEFESAIDCFDAALAARPEVEWYLLRSAAQAKLGRHVERVAGLRDGLKPTESPVLLGELCDAMIAQVAADRNPSVAVEARAIVDRELAANRHRATWLIRSARLRYVGGAQGPAQHDLYEAVEELDRRIQPSRPDPTLLAERAVARMLLRRDDEARADFLLARKHRAPAWALDPLIERFGDLPPPPTHVTE